MVATSDVRPAATAPSSDAPADADAFAAKVHKVMEDVIRPRLQRDGGDIRVERIEGSRIIVSLTGACTSCPLSAMTLSGVQQKVMEAVGRPVRLIPKQALAGLPGGISAASVPVGAQAAMPA